MFENQGGELCLTGDGNIVFSRFGLCSRGFFMDFCFVHHVFSGMRVGIILREGWQSHKSEAESTSQSGASE